MVEILIAVLCWSWYAFRKAHCLWWFSCYPQKHLITPITASIRYFSAYIRHWDEPCRAPHLTKYRVNFMSNASAALNPQI